MSIADKLTTVAENVPKVYRAGQDELWNGIVYEGRTDYAQQFRGWQMEYMRPPRKITPITVGSVNQMLRANTSLKKIESKHFDFSQLETGTSNTEGFHYTFYGCKALEEIQYVGIGVNNPVRSFNYTFYECIALKTIASITITDNTTFNCAFHHCRALENITIEGTIGQNGFNVQWSPLTYKSITSIINALADKTTDKSNTWKVTLGADNIAKLKQTDLDNVEEKGWNLA